MAMAGAVAAAAAGSLHGWLQWVPCHAGRLDAVRPAECSPSLHSSCAPAGRGNDYNLAVEGDCGWAVVEVRASWSAAHCVTGHARLP